MKTILMFILTGCLFAGASGGDLSVPHVRVFGTATTEVEPDTLKWRLSVENGGAGVAEIAEEHARLVEATLNFLKKHGIKSSEIQTSHMRLGVRRFYREREWVEDGFEAKTSVSFTFRDLRKYKDLWLGLSLLRGIAVNSTRWDSSKRIEVQNRTRTDALKAARRKAEEMTAALGSKVGAPITITEVVAYDEDTIFNRGNYLSNSIVSEANDESEEGGSVSPGAITIRVRVEVAFELDRGK